MPRFRRGSRPGNRWLPTGRTSSSRARRWRFVVEVVVRDRDPRPLQSRGSNDMASGGGPSRLFIMRPVATALLMIGIMLVGVVAYRQLPVSALPQVDYPTIQVTTFYPGAGPEVMASSVTAPMERQFGQLPGLSQMTSTSS